MFKDRPVKKRVSESTPEETTLDARHQHMVNKMASRYTQVDAMEAERAEAGARKAWLAAQTDADDNNRWAEIVALTDRMTCLDRELRTLRACEEEIEYYTETGNILFQYYDLVENQQGGVKHPSKPNARKKKDAVPTVSVLDRLHEQTEPPPSAASGAPGTSVDKGDLIDLYLTKVDPTHIRRAAVQAPELCSACQHPLICMHQDGIMYCQKCGRQELMLIEQNRPVYRQVASRESSHYSYKRINHFNEWLSQIQGKESTDIPEEIFDKILLEIKKEKIMDTTKITNAKMREILKRLKGNKYYEHLTYIMQRINNLPSPNFSPELEEKLRSMFKEIQAPFLKHCPPTRKNFLSYSYVIYKCLQLLGKDEYLLFFNLLKDRSKLHLHDQIWRNICKDLNWAMYASL